MFSASFKKTFLCQKFSTLICFQSFEKSKKIKFLRILFCSSFYIFIKKSFQSIFFIVSFSNTLISHIHDLSSLILSLGSLFCEKIVCDPLRSLREYLWSLWSPSYIFLCFVFGLVATSCVEVFMFKRGVVYSRCWVVIPQWRSLCGKSCVGIVVILLCEGGDVEEWLEPRNISSCLRLLFLSLLIDLYSSQQDSN